MWAFATQAAAVVLLAAHTVFQLRRLARLRADLRHAEEEVKFASDERRAERAGRVKAERELRQLQLRLGQLESSAAFQPLPGQQHRGGGEGQPGGEETEAGGGGWASGLDLLQVTFPLRPIGLLHSCFSRRNGTPRQPLLVPAARARLTLRPGLSADFFEGLQQYSHCWLLYVFHENTDLQRLWSRDDSGVRAKIRVPRLDGGRLGVFATRSPHRPCPLGLSVAQVVAVEGRTLVLGGADVVDGSPVLDVKPFVPFCDNVPAAAAPAWVAAKAEDEPLHIGSLRVPPGAEAALQSAWRKRGRHSLYPSFQQYLQLVREVLARDIRSVTQRIKVPRRTQHGGPAALSSGGGCEAAPEQGAAAGAATGSAPDEGYWKVVLDGVQIGYDVVEGSGDVVLRSARLAATQDA